MNKILLNQTGGFPLETDTLDFMQQAYQALQTLSALGGSHYILQGCTESGGVLSDGVVVIAGELLPFVGGTLQSTVIIVEQKESRPFENGQQKEVYVRRYATFGTGVSTTPWASLQRLKPLADFANLPTSISHAIDEDDANKLASAKAVKLLNDKVEARLPTGCILLWSGAINAIPAGFALCDGTDGRPDLRDKFVLGAGHDFAVAAEGGDRERTLNTINLPDFTLTVKGFNEVNTNWKSGGAASAGNGTGGEVNRTAQYTGNKYPFSIMPPYYALAYIIKL